jgi:catechol 2,3-dioxygenase-like lactoylglutathione lyase family enzyme
VGRRPRIGADVTGRGIDHIGLTVRDIDRSVDFYRLVLQREPIHRGDYDDPFVSQEVGYENADLRTAFFELPDSEAKLELLQYRNPQGTPNDPETCNPGNVHVALLVRDVRSEFERLQQGGVEFRQPEPVRIPLGPYEGGFSVYFRDPDGISVQLLQPPQAGFFTT